MRRKTTKEFIEQSKKIYNDRYDYSSTDYVKNNIKVKILCKTHNLYFEQTPANHLNFEGCPECYKKFQHDYFCKSTEQFINDAQKIHGMFYDYSETEYKSILEKVKVICPYHGPFLVFPTNHLKGCDCKQCGFGKISGGYFNKFFEKYPEKKDTPAVIYFYKFIRKSNGTYFFKLGISTKIDYRYSSKSYDNFTILPIWKENLTLFQAWNYELLLTKLLKDFKYTPSENFNGKTECYSIEIPKPNFISIFNHEWIKKDIILSRFNIKNHINHKFIKKIPARKTKIQIIDQKTSKDFLDENHIQGNILGKICLGLFYGSDLVSVMTFGKPRYNKNFEWELLRFSNTLNTIVVGGASKLFSFFNKTYHPKNIISYSDNRWNKGKVYTSIGMKFDHTTTPNYWYVNGNKIYSRIKCQKHKLNSFLESFDVNKTEYENMITNGFKRITDSGNSVFYYYK